MFEYDELFSKMNNRFFKKYEVLLTFPLPLDVIREELFRYFMKINK